jgi:Zn-dependent protease
VDQKLADRVVLFTLLEVPFTVNAKSWQFVPPKLVIGVVIALITLPNFPIAERILIGLGYGLLILLTLSLHIIGHILSSRMIDAPVREARITPILIEVHHHDTTEVSTRVHLIRALGGPVMNLGLGVLSLLIWNLTNAHLALAFAVSNFAIGLFVLLPVPTVDGEVIWREVGRWLRSRSN